MLFLIILGFFLAGLIFAAVNDVLTMTIPNWLSLAYVGAFPFIALFMGYPLADTGWHMLAGVIALAVCFGLFSIGVFGGGDAKLIPAVMIWIGPAAVTPYIFGIALAGGLLALLVILSRRLIPARAVPGFLQRSVVEGPGIPYAVAIAFGAIWAMPASPFLTQILNSTSLSSLTMP